MRVKNETECKQNNNNAFYRVSATRLIAEFRFYRYQLKFFSPSYFSYSFYFSFFFFLNKKSCLLNNFESFSVNYWFFTVQSLSLPNRVKEFRIKYNNIDSIWNSFSILLLFGVIHHEMFVQPDLYVYVYKPKFVCLGVSINKYNILSFSRNPIFRIIMSL